MTAMIGEPTGAGKIGPRGSGVCKDSAQDVIQNVIHIFPKQLSCKGL